MNKKEIIEEMAKEIEYAKGRVETWHCRDTNCLKCEYKNCKNSAIAEELVEQNYRKILEVSVVLSKKEHVENLCNRFEKGYEKGSKETAKEIFQTINHLIMKDKTTPLWIKETIGEIAKQYGVEV